MFVCGVSMLVDRRVKKIVVGVVSCLERAEALCGFVSALCDLVPV